jgi:succinoglycan biosynthesis transport protein ExoP
MEVTELDLHKYWYILKRRWLPAVAAFGTVMGITYLHTLSRVPIYQAQGELLFRQDRSSSLIGLQSATQANPTTQNDTSLATEAKVIHSIPILQQALEQINEASQNTTLSLESLQQGLDIVAVEGTEILQVVYRGKDPAQAALVVNQLMNIYVNKNLLNNRAAAISAGNFITAQLPKVKANLQRADLAVRNFKEKNQLTNIEQSQTALAANIERVGSQIDAVEAQLVDLDSRTQSLQRQLGMNPQQAMTIAKISQSSAIQGVLTELQTVQRQIADARSRYRDDHPILDSLQEREARFKQLLQTQINQVLQGQALNNSQLQVGEIQQELISDLIAAEVERQGLISQQATLTQQQEAYLQKATHLPKLEQQQRELERELSAAQSTYEALLRSLQEIKVIENRTVGNVRIIEYAQVPSGAINASNTSALAAGSLAGLMIAGAIVYLLELTDKKIKTAKEAREIFEYKLLGTIPLFHNDSQTEREQWRVPVLAEPRSFITESYRMLLANLKFPPSLDRSSRVILVTSSIPKEGKSTTCANLAAVMALLNYKVLIIDADLRHPSQHQIWEIANHIGLMNTITKRVGVNKKAIQPVAKNIDVLTTGTSESDLGILIDSRSMSTLITQYAKQYDYLIIDTPPLSIAADASILSKVVDGVILVTRPGIADISSSRFAKEYLDQSGQNILGIVVNGIPLDNTLHSYYRHVENNTDAGSDFKPSDFIKIKDWRNTLRFFRRP